MKLSYRWLNEFVRIDDIEPSEVALKLTMCTSEIEGIEEVGDDLFDVVVGRIIEVKPHPDADHLYLTRIDVGSDVLGIISGAPNTQKDTCVPVALVGARLPGGLVVKKAKLRGVESFGVVCSEKELGVSDDHSGLWILNDEGVDTSKLEPGTRISTLFPTKDWIIDIDNKSITHRPDLWGHYGYARELAAIFGRELRPLYSKSEMDDVLEADGERAIEVEIRDPSLCRRYTAIALGGIKVKKSPYILRRRLYTLGIRPINNIVDITNYVMLETSQPLHAFDATKIAGRKIVVRRAHQDEDIFTLDGALRQLVPETLLIADPEKGVAIAGVMGGLHSEIGEKTGEIIIESANFHPTSIRKTAALLGLRTEASNRFEKSLDPELTVYGITGSVSLVLKTISGSRIISPLADAYPGRRGEKTIALRCGWVGKMLGAPVGKDKIVSILRSLHFGVEEEGDDVLRVKVPSFRASKDVSIPQDLVEEVGRMYGYDSIEPLLPDIENAPPRRDRALNFVRGVKRILAGDLGFTEVYTYSFQDDSVLDAFYYAGTPFIGIKNPVSAGMSRLRRSLIPGLFGIIEKNAPAFEEFSVFEAGSVYNPSSSGAGERVGLPEERFRICALMLKKAGVRPAFFEMKGRIEALLQKLYVGEVELACIERIRDYSSRMNLDDIGNQMNYHPGRRALFCCEDTCFGIISELNPGLQKRIGVDFHTSRVAVCELDVQLLQRIAEEQKLKKKYRPLPRFPEVVLAHAVVVDEQVPVREVSDFISSHGSELIERVELFDMYRGAPLPPGKKNLAFNIYYRRDDRTLTEKEANEVHEAIAQRIRKQGWELRR